MLLWFLKLFNELYTRLHILQTGSLVGRICTFCICRLRRVNDDRFLLQGSHRKSSPDVPPTPIGFDPDAAVLPDALATDAIPAAAAAAAAAAATALLADISIAFEPDDDAGDAADGIKEEGIIVTGDDDVVNGVAIDKLPRIEDDVMVVDEVDGGVFVVR
ncbi:unnamed protein product [Hermetia illucens]|uniref:Uncharacterized protein n=1 Tax=Hermetia illucens TaxID=343691 RepID=A0A7R8Z0K1_HERIL|nr:unnamed protein product [Hermetia illucens]